MLPPDHLKLLQERERHLALALEAARMVAWSWDSTRDRVETTGNLQEIYGLSAVEYAAQGFGLIHAADVARHRATVDRAIQTGAAYTSEFRIIRPDNGLTVWLEERGVPTLDGAGQLVQLNGVVADVSARKHSEASLREAENLRRIAFATLDQAIMVLEMPSRILLSANPALARVFGYLPSEMIGRSTELLHIDHEHYVAFGQQLFAALDAAGAAHLEYEMRRKNGEHFYAEIVANEIRGPEGQRTATVSVVRDITARRAADAALRAARAEAEQAADRAARLQRVTAALTPAASPSEVTRVIVEQGADALGASASVVYLAQEAQAMLVMAGSVGFPEPVRTAVSRIPLDSHLPAADVYRDREPLWLRSSADLIALYPELAPTRAITGNQALAILPLLVDDHALGIMSMSFAAARDFDTSDRDFLLTLASQCALALERAYLYEAARGLNSELGQQVETRTAELVRSETRFHSLVDSVQDYAIFMLEPDGRVASWNVGAARIKGYKAEQIIGRHFSVFYPPADIAAGKPERGLKQAAEAGRSEDEGWPVRQDGTRFWANAVITPVRDSDGQLVGFAKVTRDLSERRIAEEQVRQSARRLSEAEHVAHLGSWHWDVQANVVSWSDELYRIYGLAPQSVQLTYEDFLAFVHPDDRHQVSDNVARALESRQPFAFDHRIIRVDGTERTMHSAGEALFDAHGELLALTGAGQDVTERKHIEDELHRSREQLRLLSARLENAREEERARMAREIHDELGGSLTGLKMDVAQMRRLPVGQDGPVAARLDALSLAIDEAVKTVRRIASDLRPAVLDDFGLLAAMEWQLNEFERRPELACSWNCAVETVDLAPEATTAVFRVFQESLTNIARHAEATRVDVSVAMGANTLVLQVADDGRGITPEQSLGTHSLGLVGMRERMSVMGGSVEVRGSPGQGTLVVVRVPVAG